MNKYGLQGALQAKEGKGKELAAILLEAADLLSKAKGCLIYAIGKDIEEEDLIWVTEVWDTKEDHRNSLKMEEVKELISQAMPLLERMPEKGLETIVLGGKGIG